MKRQFKYLVIIFIFAASCENGIFSDDIVRAGIYDSDFTYHNFTPPLKIETELDTTINFYMGKDSIDLDLDGEYDLIISTRFNLNDSVVQIDNNYIFPYYYIFLKNGYEMAVKDMAYGCGHGMCSMASFIAALTYNTDISNYNDWSVGDRRQDFWVSAPTANSFPPGWWTYNNTEDKYIGIRKRQTLGKIKDTYRYGWIKVNTSSLHNVTFIDFAMN